MSGSNAQANKASHGDGYYIAAAPPFRSRACWLALEGYRIDGELWKIKKSNG